MKARDVMVSPVITVGPAASVQEAAKLMLDHRVSALPVLDEQGRLVGIVSEGDLLHRAEAQTERRLSWWLRLIAADDTLAQDYIRAHARRVGDVMTREVITASPETPLDEIALLLEKNGIKRVPIVQDGRLVGIVSRANLIQAVASAPKPPEIAMSDAAIREQLLAHLKAQPWAHTDFINVTVANGTVNLWGMTNSETERQAMRVAAESIPGVRAVVDNLFVRKVEYGV
jgi:CBS domain-containing protein